MRTTRLLQLLAVNACFALAVSSAQAQGGVTGGAPKPGDSNATTSDHSTAAQPTTSPVTENMTQTQSEIPAKADMKKDKGGSDKQSNSTKSNKHHKHSSGSTNSTDMTAPTGNPATNSTSGPTGQHGSGSGSSTTSASPSPR